MHLHVPARHRIGFDRHRSRPHRQCAGSAATCPAAASATAVVAAAAAYSSSSSLVADREEAADVLDVARVRVRLPAGAIAADQHPLVGSAAVAPPCDIVHEGSTPAREPVTDAEAVAPDQGLDGVAGEQIALYREDGQWEQAWLERHADCRGAHHHLDQRRQEPSGCGIGPIWGVAGDRPEGRGLHAERNALLDL